MRKFTTINKRAAYASHKHTLTSTHTLEHASGIQTKSWLMLSWFGRRMKGMDLNIQIELSFHCLGDIKQGISGVPHVNGCLNKWDRLDDIGLSELYQIYNEPSHSPFDIIYANVNQIHHVRIMRLSQQQQPQQPPQRSSHRKKRIEKKRKKNNHTMRPIEMGHCVARLFGLELVVEHNNSNKASTIEQQNRISR